MFTPLACCWSYSTSRDINSLPFCQLQIFSWFSVINENNTSLLGFLRDLSLCFPTHFFLIWRPYMDKVLEITVITQFLFTASWLASTLYLVLFDYYLLCSLPATTCSYCSRPFVHLNVQLKKKKLIKLPVIFKLKFYKILQLNHHNCCGLPWPFLAICELWENFLCKKNVMLLKGHRGEESPTHLVAFNWVQNKVLSTSKCFWRKITFNYIAHFLFKTDLHISGEPLNGAGITLFLMNRMLESKQVWGIYKWIQEVSTAKSRKQQWR